MDFVKTFLRAVSSTCIVTENSSNYQNDLLPDIAPVLGASHGVLSFALIHPRTGRGKGPVKTHFSLEMRHVHRWVHESGKNVLKQRELWSTLHNGDGIITFTLDWVQIARDGPNIHHWRSAMAL